MLSLILTVMFVESLYKIHICELGKIIEFTDVDDLILVGLAYCCLLLLIYLLAAVFEPYKDSKVDLLGPKLLFIALNLGGLALGVWKVSFLIIIVIIVLFMFLSLNP